jgi:protein MpaA
VYAEFGEVTSKNTTLILAMVHGDEITPLYSGLALVNWLAEQKASLFQTAHVVVAPLLNPDGFYRAPRTRMNARGVDVNRNFATRDWNDKALRAWKTKFGSDPRRFPGSESRSEPETVFQEELIRRIKPQKILSIHAPLNFMDYDGPDALSLERFPREYVQRCLKLRRELKAVSGGFFPGSLGNFAGQEMGIPTLTLELPTANSALAYRYWLKFQEGIRTMIEFSVPSYGEAGG